MRAAAVAGLLFTLCLQAAPAAACDFPAVRKHIDEVLDQDKKRGEDFRRMVKEGWDPIEIMSRLGTPAMREQIDICRFHVAEYLTKRGFPPAH